MFSSEPSADLSAWMAIKARHLQSQAHYDNDHAGAVPEDLLGVFQSSQEMQEQIRLSCQRDAFHQTINTEFERANGCYPC